jgi:ATP-binding cassette subfamily B protein
LGSANGPITLDRVDIRDYSTKQLRYNINVVFQDYARYQLTAEKTLGLATLMSRRTTKTWVRLSARRALTASYRSLANGYNTILGKWFDRKNRQNQALLLNPKVYHCS